MEGFIQLGRLLARQQRANFILNYIGVLFSCSGESLARGERAPKLTRGFAERSR